MTATRIVGMALIVVGIVALAAGGLFWTDRDTVIDAGPLQVTTEKHKGVSIPPVVGIISLVGGMALLFVPRRQGA